METFDWSLIDFGQVKKNHGEAQTTCPVCSHTRKKKTDKCLSINLDEGKAYCHHCNASSFKESEDYEFKPKSDFKPRKINNEPIYQKKKKVARKPISEANRGGLTDEVVEYFKKRGISKEILVEMKVTCQAEWMPQFKKEVRTIGFNYYFDNDLVNTKFRGPQKSFKMVKDADLYFYNLNCLNDYDGSFPVVIVEGEVDALTYIQSGYPYVISVPNGANVGKMDYIENSWEKIKDVSQWIIATDNDEKGVELREEFIRRFGIDKCFVQEFEDCKDANDYYVKYGQDKFLELRPYEPSIDNVYSANSQTDYIYNIYHNGYEKAGTICNDDSYNDYYKYKLGELDVITGIPNHGKTTFMVWEMVCCSMLFGWKWAIYSPENYPAGEMFINLIEVITGKSMDINSAYRPTEEELAYSIEYINNHFYVVDMEDVDKMVTVEDVLEKVEELVKIKGVNGVLIDPFNDLSTAGAQGNERNWYMEKLTIIRKYKRKYNLKFVINAHPVIAAQRAKEQHHIEGERRAVPHYTDLDGGGAWTARVDNARVVYRNTDGNSPTNTEIHVQKKKVQKITGTVTTKDNPILLGWAGYGRYSINGFDPLKNISVIDLVQNGQE